SDGEDASKSNGEDASKSDREDASKSDGEDASKSDREDASKSDGEDASKSNGEDASKSDREDASKSDGEDASKNDGEANAADENNAAAGNTGEDDADANDADGNIADADANDANANAYDADKNDADANAYDADANDANANAYDADENDADANAPPRAFGASRTVGGILRGKALGNTPNLSDYPEMDPQGKVRVYTSNADPAEMDLIEMKSSFSMNHPVVSNAAPVLQALDGRYWSPMGRFENAISFNDSISWSREGNNQVLHLLLSSFGNPDSQPPAPGPSQPPAPSPQDILSEMFDIEDSIRLRIPGTLFSAYAKYKAYQILISSLNARIAASDWVGRRPIKRVLVEIFISHSMWQKYYEKTFPYLSQYPDMVSWLEVEKQQDTEVNLGVWGVSQMEYSFTDLIKWLANGGTLKVDRKGKGKAKEADETRSHKKGGGGSLVLCSYLVSICLWTMRIPQILWILALMFIIPGVNAASVQDSFPDVTFKAFNQFVNANFDDKISLATVLMVLFTMTDNTDLLNLHARQKHPTCDGEYASNTTGWIKSLARRIKAQLQGNTKILFTKFQLAQCTKEDDIITSLASKLDVLAEVLDLTPYDTHGKCSKCKSIYYADHESVMKSNDNSVRVYLNTAQYLKIGREIWVDRVFSNAVIGGMYSFHASAAVYTDFWNDAYGNADSTNGLRITRRHIWQAFIQESTRSIALELKLHLELDNNIPINEVTTQAFSILGEGGRIRPADGHACSECTQPFSAVPEYIPQQDPAAVVGVDENGIVPPLAIQDPASENNSNNIEPSAIANNYANDVDADYAPVKMVVLDGIVMGPTVSIIIVIFIFPS
ncbi:hypothetical protein BD779DRAFT_1454802, partial [Infundibulicybe gibba]